MTTTEPCNLLTDPWLAVQLKDGGREKIAPCEIGRDDILDINAPRADFRGALYQFLIGLLQTAFAPEHLKEWRQWWREPPDAETLEQAFAPYESAFNISAPVGEPAFMQDLTLEVDSPEPVEGLFFGGPGENTRNQNTDHFIKRNTISRVSPYWIAIALFNYQINTSGGGRGHRVTLRGSKGPLTTLLLPPAAEKTAILWERLWLNILPVDEFRLIHGNHSLGSLRDIFPWMDETRTSEKGEKTLPNDIHPLQMYWPMPSRIRLVWEEQETVCDVSGEMTCQFVSSVAKKNKGINYTGNWTHPLTPYKYDRNNIPIAFNGYAAAEGYRYWVQLILEEKTNQKRTAPALVVTNFCRSKQRWADSEGKPAHLWIFGYDLDSAKAKCWYEARLPVFQLPSEKVSDLCDYTSAATVASSEVLKILKEALKKAFFRDPKNDQNAKKFMKSAAGIDANFWSATEAPFYHLLQQLVERLDDEDAIDGLLKEWAGTLKDEARKLFDQYALSNLNEDGDLKRVVKARDGKGGLNHHLNGSRALKKLVA